MIQMKYKALLHPQLQQVLGKIANTPMAPAKSYEINKLLSAIREEIKKTREESKALLKNFVKFEGDKPKFIIDKDNAPTNDVEFIEPYGIEHPEYIATFDKFEKKDSAIAFRPWSVEMLGDVKLSAAEIDLLGALITEKPFLQAVEQKYD